QQANVAWHIASITRLSDHLLPLPGQAATEWDPVWAMPVLAIGDGHHWPGGEGLAAQLLPGMRESAEPIGEPPPFMVEEGEWRDWWASGHATWAMITERSLPIVRVVSAAGGNPEQMQRLTRELVAAGLTEDLGDGPWDLIALQSRLMTPYLVVAGEHQ